MTVVPESLVSPGDLRLLASLQGTKRRRRCSRKQTLDMSASDKE
jgi:hypothetical protein